MTIKTIPITAYSVQSARPTHAYGQPAVVPIRNSQANVYWRAPLDRIPDNATIVSAVVRFFGRSNESGSRTVRQQPVSESWNSRVTWNSRPDAAGTISVLTKSSPQESDAWDWNVTTAVQQVVSGDRVDRGWQMWGDAADDNTVLFAGSGAAGGWPRLIVEYTMQPEPPENLHPTSAVSVAKPILTFDADDRITALQIQIDPAMNATTPQFDSGERAAGGGFLDLADTTYAGLAVGATTNWRARQKVGSRWSEWSEWVDFSRLAKTTVAITTPPAGNVDDGTPTLSWTVSGGVMTAYYARLVNAQGDILDESDYTPASGTTGEWTPSRGLTRDGQNGTLILDVYDDQDRAASANDPEYVQVTRSITLALDATVTPVTSISADMDPHLPQVVLTGTRASIPDEVDVFRDTGSGEERIMRVPGVDVFTGTAYTIVDRRPIIGRASTYRVAPRVAGKTAKGGPTDSLTPRQTGIWLTDLESNQRVVIYTERGNAPEQTTTEIAIEHRPLNEVKGVGEVVRRRLVRFPVEGAITGMLRDASPGVTGLPSAQTCEDRLRAWAKQDAGHRYWLTFNEFSGEVILSIDEPKERDNPYPENRQVDVALKYWKVRTSA